jgi:drug/metabolite transporter (DMT)-like permease
VTQRQNVISREQLIGLVALTLMWGLNWPMMKLSVRELPALYFRSITMAMGAVWLGAYYLRQGIRMWPQGREWRDIVVLGVPNILLWHSFAILGVQALPSGRASILGFTMPVWTVVLGALFMGVALSWRSAVAVVAALAGIGLLISHELSALQGQPMGVLWMELGAISWGFGTLLMRRMRSTIPVQALTVWMMLLSSPFIWVAAVGTESWPALDLSPWGWVSVAYAVLINYGFAQIIWFGMARDLPASTSAMSIMAVPVVGTLCATVVVGEFPHWQDYAAMVCVVLAIATVLRPQRQPITSEPK